MKRFGYWRDPLFLCCCVLYAANRWVVKPHCHIAFFRSWFNDTLLIPCAMPLLLFVHRRFGLRDHDGVPTFGEIAVHLIGWTVLFEVLGPYLLPRVTGDWLDAVAYLGGAVVAYLWWHRERLLHRQVVVA